MMDESVDVAILDEMLTPDGAVELVAYKARSTVWIGIRPKGRRAEESPMRGAIGLRTGSNERYVDATASTHRTWGVAFGAVAPEVERVVVRNEGRELFPAVIIPLPTSFEEEFRAAWGLAAACERKCELIGYDGRGRLIAPNTIRTGERRGLSAEESLELLRQHCDNGLRYYAWALRRMPSIPEQAEDVPLVWNHLHALALVLAYVEGATDERSALLEAHEIGLRYVETVEAERWKPPFASGGHGGGAGGP
jgi:hypothetical protein